MRDSPTGVPPFLVMELIDGERITDHADAARLTVRERVSLFIDVCSAVHHAHQKGVVHRDLKPANVLVSGSEGEARPRVIDFGVARLEREAGATRFTRTGEAIGTPAYMSPEQIDGRDVDSRADVYGLGILLYELLTGALPLDSGAYRGWALLAHGQRDLPRPSVRLHELADTQVTIASNRGTDVASLRRALRGDLDWIVGRAIERDRERRHASANELAGDLQRFLSGEPVSARPPDLLYRAGKFVRRNKAAVAGSTAVVATLVLGVVTTSYFWRDSARRAEVAESRATAAEALQLVGMDPTGALVLAIAGARRAPTFEAAQALRTVLDRPHPRAVLRPAGWGVWQARFTPDDQRIVTERGEMPVTLWDAASGRQLEISSDGAPLPRPDPSLPPPSGPTPVGFSRMGDLLLVQDVRWPTDEAGPRVGVARIVDVAEGTTRSTLTGEAHRVAEAVFSPDGTRLVTTARIEPSVAPAVVSTSSLWHVSSGSPIAVLQDRVECEPGLCARPVFSPDGRLVATTAQSDGGAVRVWAADTGAGIATLSGHAARVHHVGFDPRSERLVTASVDRTARSWVARTGRLEQTFVGHQAVVDHAAFSPGGTLVATAARDNTARLWNALTGAETHRLNHEAWVSHAAFAPDGRVLATADLNGDVHLWDVASGRRLALFDGHERSVRHVSFSSDGAWLLSAAEDYSLRVWGVRDVAFGTRDASLAEGSRPAFAASGALVLARDASGRMSFIDVSTGSLAPRSRRASMGARCAASWLPAAIGPLRSRRAP